jgi:hypothetical protein
MDDFKERFKKACPRKLEELPKSYCELAVKRLKHLRTLDKDLTKEEEISAIGCPHAVFHQLSNYCYFVYEVQSLTESGMGDQEIAKILNISVDSVKAAYNDGIKKMTDSKFAQEIKETYNGDKIIDDFVDLEDETIYN